ncbi:MAG: microcystin degradation protein MlrC [Granulosicoccus sp.]|jgi:microcystin degradation protein MlrC
MAKERVAILGLWTECNSFAAVFTKEDYEANIHMFGDEITQDVRSQHPRMMQEVTGFYEEMDNTGGWCPVPILIAGGGAAGPCDAAYVAVLMARMRKDLKAALPVDAVYITAHGAMTTTEDGDPDGAVFEMVREIVGPNIPVVATLDLHANISQRMLENVDTMVSYRRDPHVDKYETGQEAAGILRELISGVRPVISSIRMPIVPPNVSLFTDSGPYAEMINYGQEQADDDILNVSILGGFAFSDTSDNGLHIIVTARSNAKSAERLCRELAEMAWRNRHRFIWEVTDLDEAMERTIQAGENSDSPAILLSDVADNIGGGGPGNTLWLLESLYESGAKGVFFAGFVDPDLAARAHDEGVGAEFDAVFQGDDWQRPDPTLSAAVKVLALHDGTFVGRLGIISGKTVYLGKACLLQVGTLQVVVQSRRLGCHDPRHIEIFDIDVPDIRTLVVKVRSSMPAAFSEYIKFEDMFFVDTKGRTSPVLTRFPWKNLPRPVLPIDPETEWEGPVITTRQVPQMAATDQG